MLRSQLTRVALPRRAASATIAATATAPLARRFLSASASLAASKPKSPFDVDETDSDSLVHPALLKDPPAANPSTATDPWTLQPPPLPEAPPIDPSITTMAQLLATPHPEGRDSEPTETLRKRLVYESRKRGILEMDLILATFAKTRLAEMNDEQLREYDRFLTLPDWSIYYYVTDKAKAPEPWASSWILEELLQHARNKGRTVRRMPDLEVKT